MPDDAGLNERVDELERKLVRLTHHFVVSQLVLYSVASRTSAASDVASELRALSATLNTVGGSVHFDEVIRKLLSMITSVGADIDAVKQAIDQSVLMLEQGDTVRRR